MDIFGMLSWYLWLALTIVSALPILYLYLTRTFDYWTKRGLKGPRPFPILGTNLLQLIKPVPLVELEWAQKYGRLYGVFNKTEPMLTVGEPELIKAILVKDFHLFSDRKTRSVSHQILNKHLFASKGDDWKRLKSILSPTFTSGKMRKMYPSIRKCLAEFLNHLEPYAQQRSEINLKDQHGNFTMDVIATCAFATQTNSHRDPNNQFMMNAKKIFEFPLSRVLLLTLLPKCVSKLFGVTSFTDESVNQFFFDITKQRLNERKAKQSSNNRYTDFIQLLVDANNKNTSNNQNDNHLNDDLDKFEAHHVNDGVEELEVERRTLSDKNIGSKTLTEDEMLAQGWIFFVAGYETTATTLTFCSYELALNPKVQNRLYDEVESAVDDHGEISYETLAKLPLLDAVLSETLRLYPPVLRLERKCQSNYKLGSTGIELYPGQDVEIPVYGIHHSKEFYPEPETFNPDRFLPENRSKIVPYTYLPFGAGPRNCIGMRFALMEAKLGLAQIVRRYRFFRSPQTAVPLEFRPITRLCAAKSVIVGIEKR